MTTTLRHCIVLLTASLVTGFGPPASGQTSPPPATMTPVSISETTGKATVQLGGSDITVPARAGHIYPPGSRFRVPDRSTAKMDVAEGVVCYLLSQSQVRVIPDPNTGSRLIEHDAGDVQLACSGSGVPAGLKTPAGTATVRKGTVSSSVKPSPAETRTYVSVVEGPIEWRGRFFRMPWVDTGTVLAFNSTPRDIVMLVATGDVSVAVPGPSITEVTRRLPQGTLMMVGWNEEDGEVKSAFIFFDMPDGTEESWDVVVLSDPGATTTDANTAMSVGMSGNQEYVLTGGTSSLSTNDIATLLQMLQELYGDQFLTLLQEEYAGQKK